MSRGGKQDLYLLVADKTMEFAIRGALDRPAALGIRAISYKIDVHTGKDGGVRTSGAQLLNLQRERFHHGLLVLDYEGSGAGDASPIELEDALRKEINRNWEPERAAAIVIDPEVDRWVWGSDKALAEILQWPSRPGIRDWLRTRGYTFDALDKPIRPKEAFEDVVRHLRLPRSSALYRKITSRISLSRCTDPAFHRLRDQLRRWFSSGVNR